MGMITNPSKRKSYNCYSGGICYLLERKGVYLSEHNSFGLSAGLNFEIQAEKNLTFRAVRELHCLTDFVFSLGIKVLECVEDDYISFLNEIKKNIDVDMPIMFDYDGFYFSFTQIFQKKHEKRIALIVGYDEKNLYISDFIYGAYEVPVAYELFEQAVTPAHGACVSSKWYDVSLPENINDKITSELVLKSISETYTYFNGRGLSGENNMIGLEGIEIFSEIIQKFMYSTSENYVDWGEVSEDLKQAVITFRQYGDFILDISAIILIGTSREDMKQIQMLFHEVSTSWQKISHLLFKYSLTSKEKLIPKISKEILGSLSLLEKAFYYIDVYILQKNEKIIR